MKRFPEVSDHEAVTCFNCDEPLAKVLMEQSGYADGGWRKKCPACGMKTFYSLRDQG